jgi:hypothetical protein
MSKLALTIEKPTSPAEIVASLANVVRISKQARRHAKLELVTSANGGHSWKEAIAPLWAAVNAGPNSGSGRRDAVSDFLYAGRGHATVAREGSTNEDEIHLTLMDFIAIALIFLSPAFGPGLAWLLLRTAS